MWLEHVGSGKVLILVRLKIDRCQRRIRWSTKTSLVLWALLGGRVVVDGWQWRINVLEYSKLIDASHQDNCSDVHHIFSPKKPRLLCLVVSSYSSPSRLIQVVDHKDNGNSDSWVLSQEEASSARLQYIERMERLAPCFCCRVRVRQSKERGEGKQ